MTKAERQRLEREFATLPTGSIVRRTIRGAERFYHQWRENGTTTSRYLKAEEVAPLRALIARRKEIKRLLSGRAPSVAVSAFRTDVATGRALVEFARGVEKFEKRDMFQSVMRYLRSDVADRVLVILSCRDYRDVRAYLGYWDGMEEIARDREPEPIVSIEDIAVKDPDKSKWESFCGKYEHPEDADFIVDEVFMKDGELHANAIDEDGDEMSFRLYPIGEDEFGRKGGLLKLKFGDGCLMFDDYTCKKL